MTEKKKQLAGDMGHGLISRGGKEKLVPRCTCNNFGGGLNRRQWEGNKIKLTVISAGYTKHVLYYIINLFSGWSSCIRNK
jgi:hypothetical protein